MKKIKNLVTVFLLVLSFQLSAQTVDQERQELRDAIDLVDEVTVVTLNDGTEILADINGLSLYTFDVDQNGESKCFGQCLVIWPALVTEEKDFPEPFDLHTRPDGTFQIVLKGSPLYYFINDQKEGDVFGDGLNGVWHLINL